MHGVYWFSRYDLLSNYSPRPTTILDSHLGWRCDKGLPPPRLNSKGRQLRSGPWHCGTVARNTGLESRKCKLNQPRHKSGPQRSRIPPITMFSADCFPQGSVALSGRQAPDRRKSGEGRMGTVLLGELQFLVVQVHVCLRVPLDLPGLHSGQKVLLHMKG